jgi:hypothetical protein
VCDFNTRKHLSFHNMKIVRYQKNKLAGTSMIRSSAFFPSKSEFPPATPSDAWTVCLLRKCLIYGKKNNVCRLIHITNCCLNSYLTWPRDETLAEALKMTWPPFPPHPPSGPAISTRKILARLKLPSPPLPAWRNKTWVETNFIAKVLWSMVSLGSGTAN